MNIDIEALRNDLMACGFGVAFVGGFGGGLVESFDIANMSDDELIDYALSQGIDLSNYEI